MIDPLTLSLGFFGVSALLARKAKIDAPPSGPVDSKGQPIAPVAAGSQFDDVDDPNYSLGATTATATSQGNFGVKAIGSGAMAGMSIGMAVGPLGAVVGTVIGAGIGGIIAVIERMKNPVEYEKWDWDSWGMPNRPDLTRFEDGRFTVTIPAADLFTPQELTFSEEWVKANLCHGNGAVFASWKRGGVFAWYPQGVSTPFQALLYQAAPWLTEWEETFLRGFSQKVARYRGVNYNLSWANFADSIVSEKGVGERIQIVRRAHVYQSRGFAMQAWETIGWRRTRIWSHLDVLDFKSDNEDVREVHNIMLARMAKLHMSDVGYPGAFDLTQDTELTTGTSSGASSVVGVVDAMNATKLASNLAMRAQPSVGVSNLTSNDTPPMRFALWIRTGPISVGRVVLSTESFKSLYGSNKSVLGALVRGEVKWSPTDGSRVSARFEALFPGLREAKSHARILQRYKPQDWPTKGTGAYPTNRSGGLTRIDKATGKVSQITSGLTPEGDQAWALARDTVLDWYQVPG